MRKQLLTLLMAVILFLLPSINFGQTAPVLGTASSFALFTAAGAFTVNGASTVTGDVGTNAGAFSGFGTPDGSPGTLIGNIHVVDGNSGTAATDVVAAYADLFGRVSDGVKAVELAGQTFTRGVWNTGGASTLTGELTLNAEGDPTAVFIIKIGGALAVAGASNVKLINSATPSNVYWQIGGQFDLADGSFFRGTAIVDGAINLYGTSTLIGRGLSKAGAINIQINNVSLGELTWDGSTDTNWHTAANWDANVVPTVDYNVTIPSGLTNYPTLSSAGACNNLTIQSASGSTGSLIAQNYLTVIGTVTIQRYMPDAVWHMLGSPLGGQTINSTFLDANSIIGMKDYIEGDDDWSTDYLTAAPNVAFSLGKGYATKRNTSGTVNLTGAPNTAIVEVTLTKGAGGYGWNLLSNPFTSAIAANIEGGADNLITNNTAVLHDSYEALYIWNGSAYVIINHFGGTPGVTLTQNYLQVGQGFFVKSVNPAVVSKFQITPSMQSHQTNIAFKSDEIPWTTIVLNAEKSNTKISTQISYQENMSRGLDVGYDAGIMKSNPAFAIYSRLVEDNGIDFGIQCLPKDYENLVIPIGLDAKSGDIIKFTAQTNNLPTEYIAYLEDRTLGLFTNLSTNGAEYSIQLLSDSKGTGRFFIRTSIESALGIGDLDLDNPFKVFTRPNNNQIVIRGEANANTIARVYSITGKQVAGFNLKQSSENLVQFNEEAGIYIVKISNEQGTSTQKFAWVK